MPAYDSIFFSPPAPLARVTLRDPESDGTVSGVPMLVDTGADITLIPQASVRQLGVTIEPGGYELMGFDGSKSVAQAVRLNLELLGKTFKGKFLLVDQEWGLVGRDVLNHLSLLFDGPRSTWGEQRSSGG
ncbi:MAG TPA: retropepsin-like aspartic protease [Thermoanaerobaculia bacterium]|nr:retropepsin-like aspartic protease [Thermoanaerobaculia bacterium]